MSEVTINNSPVHSDSIITAAYGETGSEWQRFHTGIDFAPYGSTGTNPDLYSVTTGQVYSKGYDNSLGNYLLIEDTNGYFWRYCHMQSASPLNVGDNVTTLTKVGVMGDTGNVTGIHLHLEYAATSTWDYDTFLNPATELGIPNERNTIVHYSGVIPPTPSYRKAKFKWVLYAKKLRERRL